MGGRVWPCPDSATYPPDFILNVVAPGLCFARAVDQLRASRSVGDGIGIGCRRRVWGSGFRCGLGRPAMGLNRFRVDRLWMGGRLMASRL